MFHTFAVPKTRRGSSLKLFGNNKEGKREGREFTPVNDRPTMRRLTQLSPKRNEKREHSSVGSERLPYKQRVGGSTPSAPTKDKEAARFSTGCFFVFMGNLRICLKIFMSIKTFKQILILFAETAVLFIGDRLKPFI